MIWYDKIMCHGKYMLMYEADMWCEIRIMVIVNSSNDQTDNWSVHAHELICVHLHVPVDHIIW